MEYKKGQFTPSKYPTPELKVKVMEMLKNGVSDTEIAKYLMMERNVALYMSVRLIQKAKKRLLDNQA